VSSMIHLRGFCVERQNLRLRISMGARLTNGFSKKPEKHAAIVHSTHVMQVWPLESRDVVEI
jgi:hypothetical protein